MGEIVEKDKHIKKQWRKVVEYKNENSALRQLHPIQSSSFKNVYYYHFSPIVKIFAGAQMYIEWAL